MKQKKKGGFTFKSAGVLFILSAVFELAFVTGEAPLFGAMRGGAVAVAYHLVYVVLFAVVGIGLLKEKPWGFKLVMVAMVLNTADRFQLIADRATLDGYVTHSVSKIDPSFQELFHMLPSDAVSDMMVLMALLFVACWWGFAIYAYVRRDYFQDAESRNDSRRHSGDSSESNVAGEREMID